MTDKPLVRKAAYALLCSSAVLVLGCNKQPSASSTAPASASSSAQQAAPYTPPTADQLYQMVAPIALFPDKLLAQVLAGSTYPDQVTAADNLLAQNPNLKGDLLQTAIAPQPWDPSVKGLTAFPAVLNQMAQNIQWTTALGEAYVNDPTDVMNAIQVMRQHAAKNGNLRSSAQQDVVVQPAAAPAPTATYVDNGEPPVYSGPSVVPAPDETYEIDPAQPDEVYVPSYDPQTVYGEEVPAYPGYAYVQPAGYSTGELVTVGAVAFGAAILVGSLLDHHDHYNNPPPAWGWNNWGMRWNGANRGGWQRPAVVYNNNTYVSRSTTVVNRYTTNSYNNRTVNNYNYNSHRTTNNFNAPQAAANRPAAPGASQPMSMPHFGAPVRGAEPARNGPAMAAPQHQAPAQAMARPQAPAPAARTPHASPEAQTRPAYHAASPSMVQRPATPPPAPRREVVRPAAPRFVPPPQPERTAPAPRPAAPVQAAPRPEFARPAPMPAQAPRPAPAPPPAARNEARPAPAQRAPSKPPKKEDNQNGH